MSESVKCEYGHIFVIKEVVLPVEVRAQIVPCPYVGGWEGIPCGGKVVWKNPLKYELTK